MPKVKCAGCGEYLERDEAVRNGVQSFHPEHMYSSAPSRPKPRKKKPGVTNDLRSTVLRLDGGCCRFCGVWGGESLHVHHVIYRSQGGPHEQSNLLSLCVGCHSEVHSDKRRFQRLCLGVIWLRSVNGDKRITVPRLERMLNEAS